MLLLLLRRRRHHHQTAGVCRLRACVQNMAGGLTPEHPKYRTKSVQYVADWNRVHLQIRFGDSRRRIDGGPTTAAPKPRAILPTTSVLQTIYKYFGNFVKATDFYYGGLKLPYVLNHILTAACSTVTQL